MTSAHSPTRSESSDDEEDIICNMCGVELCSARPDTFEVLPGGLIPFKRCNECKAGQAANDALGRSHQSFVDKFMAHVDAGRIDNEDATSFSQRLLDLLEERDDARADRDVFRFCLERLADRHKQSEPANSGHKRKEHGEEEEHASEAPAAKAPKHDDRPAADQ